LSSPNAKFSPNVGSLELESNPGLSSMNTQGGTVVVGVAPLLLLLLMT